MGQRITELVKEYGRRLQGQVGNRLMDLRLFGSYARGDAHESSDIDVLAVVADLSWEEKKAAVNVGTELSLESGFHLAPVVMNQTEFVRLVGLDTADSSCSPPKRYAPPRGSAPTRAFS